MATERRNNFSLQNHRATQEEIDDLVNSNPALKSMFPKPNILSLVSVKDTAGFTYSSRFNKDNIKQSVSKEKNTRTVNKRKIKNVR